VTKRKNFQLPVHTISPEKEMIKLKEKDMASKISKSLTSTGYGI